MKRSKILKRLFLSLFFLFASEGLEAAALHTILVADTTDFSIGEATVIDLYKMSYELNKAADYAGMDCEQTIIWGRDVRPRTVLDLIESLQFSENDTVVFYYSGHGYRTEDKDNPWPNLHFSLVRQGVDLSYIRDRLEEKNPRFLIVMADVCNHVMPNEYCPELIPKFMVDREDMEIVEANYRSLFTDVRGTLMISSSSAGEFSWTIRSGGVFTAHFLRSLRKAAAALDYPEWEGILQQAALLLEKGEENEQQHPQWEFIPK